jgi:hypothetical protein
MVSMKAASMVSMKVVEKVVEMVAQMAIVMGLMMVETRVALSEVLKVASMVVMWVA